MVNFKKYLQQSKDRKYSAIASKKDSETNPYSCNYSPKSGHKYCEHEHCIFDSDWVSHEIEVAKLRNQLRNEEDYLKNGEGTVGYDMKSVYKNVLKLRKMLKEE